MIEVLMALAIIGAMVAVTIPVVTDRMRKSQIETAASSLDGLRQALVRFRTNVGRSPRYLFYLQLDPTGGQNSCNSGFSGAEVAKWKGPYVLLEPVVGQAGGGDVPDTLGISLGDWQVNDLLIRTPATVSGANNLGRLDMAIPGVRLTDANALNTLVDGPTIPPQNGIQDTAGLVRWGALSNGSTTVMYGFAINGC